MPISNTVLYIAASKITYPEGWAYFSSQEHWNWGSMDERKTPVHPSVRSVVGTGTNSDKNMAQKIDKISRLTFPILFIVFNIFYHFYFNIL